MYRKSADADMTCNKMLDDATKLDADAVLANFLARILTGLIFEHLEDV
jgi:hypothetical protein